MKSALHLLEICFILICSILWRIVKLAKICFTIIINKVKSKNIKKNNGTSNE